MRIGIDIDNTITNTSEVSNYLLKSDERFNHVDTYRELDEVLKKEYLTDYLKYAVLKTTLKDNVLDVLKYFKDKGDRLVFITARGNEVTKNFENLNSVGLTSIYFAKNNLIYDKIIFFQDNKKDACLKEDIDIFIDDKEEVLNEIKKANIKTIRMSNKDTTSNHLVLTNWLDIKDYIEAGCKDGR